MLKYLSQEEKQALTLLHFQTTAAVVVVVDVVVDNDENSCKRSLNPNNCYRKDRIFLVIIKLTAVRPYLKSGLNRRQQFKISAFEAFLNNFKAASL